MEFCQSDVFQYITGRLNKSIFNDHSTISFTVFRRFCSACAPQRCSWLIHICFIIVSSFWTLRGMKLRHKADLRGSFSLCFSLISRFSGLTGEGRFSLTLHWSQLRRLSSISIRAPGAPLAPFKITHSLHRRKTTSVGRNSNFRPRY